MTIKVWQWQMYSTRKGLQQKNWLHGCFRWREMSLQVFSYQRVINSLIMLISNNITHLLFMIPRLNICWPNKFKCYNGRCIEDSKRCDRIPDCSQVLTWSHIFCILSHFSHTKNSFLYFLFLIYWFNFCLSVNFCCLWTVCPCLYRVRMSKTVNSNAWSMSSLARMVDA